MKSKIEIIAVIGSTQVHLGRTSSRKGREFLRNRKDSELGKVLWHCIEQYHHYGTAVVTLKGGLQGEVRL